MHAVFYSSAEQQAAALASAARIEKKRGKIATHILPRTEVSSQGTGLQQQQFKTGLLLRL
jgi:hypothetical protein